MEKIFEKFYNTLKSNNVNTTILENNLRTLKVHEEVHQKYIIEETQNIVIFYDILVLRKTVQ